MTPAPLALPHNLEAEQALLGALMFDNAVFDRIGSGLRGSHFYEPFHQRLFDVIAERIRAGQLAEPTVLIDRFRHDPASEEFGGLRYLADLMDRAPPGANAPEYAETISDLATRRELIRLAGEIIKDAPDPDHPATKHVIAAERALSELANAGTDRTAWAKVNEVIGEAVVTAKAKAGRIELPTGLIELDRLTGGLRRGEMQIIAGRPAMGKSSAGLTVARSLASQGNGVAFFSMEMPRTALGLRMACDLAYDPDAPIYSGETTNPTYFKADRNELDANQWKWLEDAAARVASWPLLFDARPGLTVGQMESCARRAIRDWDRKGITPGAIIVDHLTIARADQDRKGNKVAEVGDISRSLAEMAKRLDVPVVALCQLSRQVEARTNADKRPSLSDLRWSGEIEQDARLVMFLYRPEYYCRRPEDESDHEAMMEWKTKLDKVRRRLWWLVEKNNNGPTGEVETHCDIACSAIRDRRGVQ